MHRATTVNQVDVMKDVIRATMDGMTMVVLAPGMTGATTTNHDMAPLPSGTGYNVPVSLKRSVAATSALEIPGSEAA